MKKVTLLCLVLILLAVSVVPVMAAGPNNGHGNGGNSGQGNSAGNQIRQQDKDQLKIKNQDGTTHPGLGVNGNHGGRRMRTPFYLQGAIFGTTANTITVTLIHGNAQVKQSLGKELTLQVPATTKIFQITQGGEGEESGETGAPATSGESITTNGDDDTPGNRVPTTLDKLVAGQKVAIHGNVVAGVFIATLITVYIQTPALPPG
jgi:hypothetical protein